MDSPEGLYFYVTSFWTSKLFRTGGFLVILVRRHVQLFHFHHCKRHLKKLTIALDLLPPPPSVRCVRSWKWWQLWTTPYTYLSWTQSNYNRASDAPVRVCVCVRACVRACVCVCVCVCVNRLLERLMSPSPKSQVMFVPHSHESVIFSYICHSVLNFFNTFYTPGAYALTRSQLCSAHELCPRAEHCDWSASAQGVKTMLGVSLRARRHTTQVMLGLSLRARWDTTLVMWIAGKLQYRAYICICTAEGILFA